MFGDGKSAYNSRDTKKHSIMAMQKAFRIPKLVQTSVKHNTELYYEREQTFRLCCGQELGVRQMNNIELHQNF